MTTPPDACPGCRELWSTLPALHFCAGQEPDRPYNARSGPTDAAIPETVLQSPGLSPGAASEAGPLDQPMPRQVGGEHVSQNARDWFLETLAKQRMKGLGRYGVELHTGNGRDALQDAMDELVDAVQYVTQATMERNRLHVALRRWLAAKEAWEAMNPETTRDDASQCVHDLAQATRALEQIAREVCR